MCGGGGGRGREREVCVYTHTYICMCSCSCVNGCMQVHMQICVHECESRKSTSGVFLNCSPHPLPLIVRDTVSPWIRSSPIELDLGLVLLHGRGKALTESVIASSVWLKPKEMSSLEWYGQTHQLSTYFIKRMHSVYHVEEAGLLTTRFQRAPFCVFNTLIPDWVPIYLT